eukprot:CAMPEP_0204313458 /NCGR_PEP_ID=MMETSP0469-20131031/3606_1 /ASSEMBLY_ACC=CAM_ASM_000384 /TAXON_ID=2969 /ORGANISM="Oxyrrhis marina" /LENGTH=140 /DNA_ID=CAMNT_0051293755 /DNA_START=319 /DNA_END=738 /DNA_ORIENTATION=+
MASPACTRQDCALFEADLASRAMAAPQGQTPCVWACCRDSPALERTFLKATSPVLCPGEPVALTEGQDMPAAHSTFLAPGPQTCFGARPAGPESRQRALGLGRRCGAGQQAKGPGSGPGVQAAGAGPGQQARGTGSRPGV